MGLVTVTTQFALLVKFCQQTIFVTMDSFYQKRNHLSLTMAHLLAN